MKKFILLIIILFAFNQCSVDNDNIAVADCNKCIGDEVQICDQIWMTKNLNIDHYRNGDSIPEVKDSIQWMNLITGAWCYFENDSAKGRIYGKLYNWYAVNDSRGLTPEGWHVPTDDEWKELEMCLGMTQSEGDETRWRGTDEGGKLKTTGTIEGGNGLWYGPNTGATNETCFSALPGGARGSDGLFLRIGGYGYWWSSSDYGVTGAWFRRLDYNIASILRETHLKKNGFSVRCVKD